MHQALCTLAFALAGLGSMAPQASITGDYTPVYHQLFACGGVPEPTPGPTPPSTPTPCIPQWSDWSVSTAPSIKPEELSFTSADKIGAAADNNESILLKFTAGAPPALPQAIVSASVTHTITAGEKTCSVTNGCPEPTEKAPYAGTLDTITWAVTGMTATPATGTGAAASFTIEASPTNPIAPATLTYTVNIKGSNPTWGPVAYTKSIPLVAVEMVEEVETNESAGCTGYDDKEKALMVPKQGSNKIWVKIHGPSSLLAKVKIKASDPAKLTIQPETPSSSNELLTFSGTTDGLGVKIQLDVNGPKADLLEADVLKKLDETIEIHAITESNDDV